MAICTNFACIIRAFYTLVLRVFMWYNGIEERGDTMPIRYKIDVLAALKEAGYSTYKLRQMKLFGERNIQKIREGEVLNADNLAKICELLHCQPGDILEYVEE